MGTGPSKKTRSLFYIASGAGAVFLVLLYLCSAGTFEPRKESTEKPAPGRENAPGTRSSETERLASADSSELKARDPAEGSTTLPEPSKGPIGHDADELDRPPDEIDRLRFRAYRQAKAGELEQAIDLILKALRMEPDNSRLQREVSHLFSMRGFRSLKRKDYERALGFFRESLHYWEDNPKALRGMGVTYYRRRDRDRAEDWLLRFVEKGGDRPGVYTLLGRINYERDRLEDALYYFRVSLALSPEQPEISKLADKVRREIKVEVDFASRESRHFRVKYEGTAAPATASLVLRVCEEAYLDIGSELGFYPEFPVTVILYTDKQFSEVTRSPAWAEAIFDGKIRIPVQGLAGRSRVLERLIFHEFTHALVHEAGRGRAPIWLHEGMAQTMEGVERSIPAIAGQVTEAGGPFPLSSLENNFLGMPAGKAKAAYLESWLAVKYLDEKYGPFVMSEMLDSLHHRGSIEDAVRRVASRSYRQVDQDFRRWVREKAKAP
ncbi:MAG: tetratricopeptide repeat protein [bacterium]